MIIPIAVLVAVAMSVVVGFVWFSAKNQDRIALRQSIDSVRDAIRRKAEQVGLVAKDYSWWTDAFSIWILASISNGRTRASALTSTSIISTR